MVLVAGVCSYRESVCESLENYIETSWPLQARRFGLSFSEKVVCPMLHRLYAHAAWSFCSVCYRRGGDYTAVDE